MSEVSLEHFEIDGAEAKAMAAIEKYVANSATFRALTGTDSEHDARELVLWDWEDFQAATPTACLITTDGDSDFFLNSSTLTSGTLPILFRIQIPREYWKPFKLRSQWFRTQVGKIRKEIVELSLQGGYRALRAPYLASVGPAAFSPDSEQKTPLGIYAEQEFLIYYGLTNPAGS